MLIYVHGVPQLLPTEGDKKTKYMVNLRSIYILQHRYGLGHPKNMLRTPFILSFYDFKNEVSHAYPYAYI